MSRTNGELLKSALDALGELVRRGNHTLEDAERAVAFQYEDYLALKSRVVALEKAEAARDFLADMYDELDPGDCPP